MQKQNNFLDDIDLNNAMIDLQVLGICLKRSILELPDSTVKSYLLLEVAKSIALNNVNDFNRLKNKISNLVIALESLNGIKEVLDLLEEIKELVKKVINYLENCVEI